MKKPGLLINLGQDEISLAEIKAEIEWKVTDRVEICTIFDAEDYHSNRAKIAPPEAARHSPSCPSFCVHTSRAARLRCPHREDWSRANAARIACIQHGEDHRGEEVHEEGESKQRPPRRG